MAGKKKRMGRPPLDPGQVRRHYFTIRMNDEEHGLVTGAAGGQKASDWAREVLLRAARRRKRS